MVISIRFPCGTSLVTDPPAKGERVWCPEHGEPCGSTQVREKLYPPKPADRD